MTQMFFRVSALAFTLTLLAACGTIKEKTSPCKRPTELTGFAQEPMICGSMERFDQTDAAIAIQDILGSEALNGV